MTPQRRHDRNQIRSHLGRSKPPFQRACAAQGRQRRTLANPHARVLGSWTGLRRGSRSAGVAGMGDDQNGAVHACAVHYVRGSTLDSPTCMRIPPDPSSFRPPRSHLRRTCPRHPVESRGSLFSRQTLLPVPRNAPLCHRHFRGGVPSATVPVPARPTKLPPGCGNLSDDFLGRTEGGRPGSFRFPTGTSSGSIGRSIRVRTERPFGSFREFGPTRSTNLAPLFT